MALIGRTPSVNSDTLPGTLGTAARPLYKMFVAVPRRYDLLNRLLTWGWDERWRRQAARECLRAGFDRVLDLCCGTADLALHLAQHTRKGTVVGADYALPMLETARKKRTTKGLERRVAFVQGDAAALPFPEQYFAAIGISFAFRNLTYRNPFTRRYLKEILRVLVSGGRCVIVETSQPRSALLRTAYHLYLRTVVPRLGGLLSGHKGAYRYLAKSAIEYYRPDEVSQLLVEAGFQQVQFRPLLGGIAAIHVAIK